MGCSRRIPLYVWDRSRERALGAHGGRAISALTAATLGRYNAQKRDLPSPLWHNPAIPGKDTCPWFGGNTREGASVPGR